MKVSRYAVAAWVVLMGVGPGMLGGCGSSKANEPATGGERQACYGNGTCNEGLSCLSDICVKANNTGIGGGSSLGAGGSGGAIGSGGKSTGGSASTAGGTPSVGGASAGGASTGGTSAGGAEATGGSGGASTPTSGGLRLSWTLHMPMGLGGQPLLLTCANFPNTYQISVLVTPMGSANVIERKVPCTASPLDITDLAFGSYSASVSLLNDQDAAVGSATPADVTLSAGGCDATVQSSCLKALTVDIEVQ